MGVKINEISSKLCCVDSWGFYNYAVGFFKSHSLKNFFGNIVDLYNVMFQVYSKVFQLFFFSFYFIKGYYKLLTIVWVVFT